MYEDYDESELKPLQRWKKYREEGGFYDYQQWLEENGYIKTEQWAPIPEFDGMFEASDMGRIKNAWTDKVLKQQTNRKGYKTVTVKVLDKIYTRTVHVLVASSFLDNYQEGMDVHHKDRNKANNRLDNLECCTRKEHVKLSIEEGSFNYNNFGKKRIKIKCNENGKIYNSINECSRDIDVDVSIISQYLKGKVKTSCKGYTFEKVEEGGSDGGEVD